MQFHNPKNLACSIVIEAAELLECFQWKDFSESNAAAIEQRHKIAGEIADIAIYLIELSDNLEIDLRGAIVTSSRSTPKNTLSERQGAGQRNTIDLTDESLAVYVAQDSHVNLTHALEYGIWGFKNRAKPDDFGDLQAGDLILLGSGYSGGSPEPPWTSGLNTRWRESMLRQLSGSRSKARRPNGRMNQACLSRIVMLIESGSINPMFKLFPTLASCDETIMSHTLSDSLRKSGSNAGRGYVREAEDVSREYTSDRGVQRTKGHWIFQGNPRVFGVDEYIRTCDEIRWSVRHQGWI